MGRTGLGGQYQGVSRMVRWLVFSRSCDLYCSLHLHCVLPLPVLGQDIDCSRVVSTVGEVQGSELGHQVHEAAPHSLLVLRKPAGENRGEISDHRVGDCTSPHFKGEALGGDVVGLLSSMDVL